MRQCIALWSFICSGRRQISISWSEPQKFPSFYASSKSSGCHTSQHSFSSFILMGSKEFGIFSFRNWYRLTLTFLSMLNALQSSVLECGEQSWILINLMKEGNTSDLLNSFKPLLQKFQICSCSPFAAMVAASLSIICALNIHPRTDPCLPHHKYPIFWCHCLTIFNLGEGHRMLANPLQKKVT